MPGVAISLLHTLSHLSLVFDSWVNAIGMPIFQENWKTEIFRNLPKLTQQSTWERQGLNPGLPASKSHPFNHTAVLSPTYTPAWCSAQLVASGSTGPKSAMPSFPKAHFENPRFCDGFFPRYLMLIPVLLVSSSQLFSKGALWRSQGCPVGLEWACLALSGSAPPQEGIWVLNSEGEPSSAFLESKL